MSSADKLYFAVIPASGGVQLFGRTEGVPVAGMPDRNRAVDVRQLDSRSAASQLPVQVMTHPLMVMYLQAEIIANRAMHGRGF